ADWLKTERIGAVIDATHPFAARITPRTASVCAGLGLPHIAVKRPPWLPGPGECWTGAADEASAARLVPPGATVFLATGRQRLDRFAGISAARVWVRVVDPPEQPFPFPVGDFVVARPTFKVADEVALFDRLGIDWLVARNAGGASGRAKLDAARLLGINVAMIVRPELPEGLHLTDVAGALAWARALAVG
ncbi:MAG: precorrin-6A/cobalt-precorrin-6A reductase, partial [Mangrovicoccus sp.]|nr:precorrin-6A/cobalt-precorrin-6A reductase [Mangrovicoccus sp.]